MLGGYAHALCIDADGDGAGVGATCTLGADCDEGDPAVNPAAAEDGTDPVDDDCDESPLTRRAYVTGFEVNYINDWNVTGTVLTVSPGMIRLWPTATTPAVVALKRDFNWVKGLLTVNVRFAAAPTTACSVIVSGPTTSATQSLGTPTGAKTVSVTFPLILPGQTVTDAREATAGAVSGR